MKLPNRPYNEGNIDVQDSNYLNVELMKASYNINNHEIPRIELERQVKSQYNILTDDTLDHYIHLNYKTKQTMNESSPTYLKRLKRSMKSWKDKRYIVINHRQELVIL